MRRTHSLHCFFWLDQQKIYMCYHINQICCFPGNTKDFLSNWSIKYFRRYIAIQIGHTINIKGKCISFVKLHFFPIIGFYWKVQKTSLYKDLHVLLEFQLIRINILIIIFKSIFVESANIIYKSKNIWKCTSLLQITFFVWRNHFLS